MSRRLRILLSLISVAQLLFAAAFFVQWPPAISLWPLAGTTPLTYILLAAFFAAAAEGFTTVINLAPVNPPYTPADEAGLARQLGLTYIYIPVAWNNPTDADFAAFEQAMDETAGGKTLIHCAANFRVTAFYSLYAQKHLGLSAAQADALRDRIWAGSDYPVWEAFVLSLIHI